jgi:hypothetical protein
VEWLAGGERERGMDFTGGGGNGATVARDGVEGRAGQPYMHVSLGDGG